jgi:hypothetical protein
MGRKSERRGARERVTADKSPQQKKNNTNESPAKHKQTPNNSNAYDCAHKYSYNNH